MIITHPSGVRITQDHLTKSPSERYLVGREVKGSSLFIIKHYFFVYEWEPYTL